MTGMDQQWVAFVTVDDRNGALTATTECFSTRGVSFASVNTLDVHAGIGTLAFLFAGSDRIARLMGRTLGRVATVRDVRIAHADDPQVRALAQVRPRADGADAAGEVDAVDAMHAGAAPDADAVRRGGVDTVTTTADGALIVAGPLAAVRTAIADLRAAGGAEVAWTLLPPRAQPAGDTAATAGD